MESPISKPTVAVLATLVGITLVAVTAKVIVSTNRDMREMRSGAGTNVITVSGEGKVVGKPDIGKVQLTVVSQGTTPGDATKDGTTKYDALLAAVKGLGVTAEDMKTTGYYLNPRYTYNPSTGEQSIDGYELRQSLEVKVRDISKVGTVISEATDAGVNQIDNLLLDIDKPEDLLAQAREQGIADAKAKAAKLAETLDVELGTLTGYSESQGGYIPPMYYGKMDAMGGGGGPAPIEPGSQEVSLAVTLTFSIEK